MDKIKCPNCKTEMKDNGECIFCPKCGILLVKKWIIETATALGYNEVKENVKQAHIAHREKDV
jgi:hypothetical protein